jgi:hypothetical protein
MERRQVQPGRGEELAHSRREYLRHKKLNDALDTADEGDGTVRVHRKYVEIPKLLPNWTFSRSLCGKTAGAQTIG